MDQNYENVRYLLDELISFRIRAPQDISDIHAKYNKKILKCLRDMKIRLQISDVDYNIPDNMFDDVNLKHIQQQDEKLCDKMYEDIQFLSILIKKKNCPISKIIDDI